MKAYIICLVITLIINLIAEKIIKKNKVMGILLLIISLFIVCFIAGVRNIYTGRDIRVYVMRLYNQSLSYTNIFTYLKNSNSDILFAIIVFVGSLSNNINVVLFLIELCVALPIYIYAYLNRNSVNLAITIEVFMLTMYCVSFNNMRQSIAISICILEYYFINKNSMKKAVLLNIIACFFHKTAFIFLLVIVLYKLCKKNEQKNLILVMFILLVFLIGVTPILNKIISNSYYSYYLDTEDNYRDFSLLSILKKMVFLLLWIFCLIKSKKNKNTNIIFGLIISTISVYCTIVSFKIPGMGRVGFYFNDLQYFLIMMYFPKIFKQKQIITVCLVILLTFMWWKMTKISDDSSEVYPYQSDMIVFLNEKGVN